MYNPLVNLGIRQPLQFKKQWSKNYFFQYSKETTFFF